MEIKTLTQVARFDGTPHQIYEMLMDSRKHSAFTESDAKISRNVGGKFTVWDGWIHGINLELVKDRKIIQAWRERTWPEDHYSIAKFELRKKGPGTELHFTQTGIPKRRLKSITEGWKRYYWQRIREVLQE